MSLKLVMMPTPSEVGLMSDVEINAHNIMVDNLKRILNLTYNQIAPKPIKIDKTAITHGLSHSASDRVWDTLLDGCRKSHWIVEDSDPYSWTLSPAHLDNGNSPQE